MLTSTIAALAAVLVIQASPAQRPAKASAVARDGRVREGGIAFTLPAGMAHDVLDDRNGRTWTAVNEDRTALLAVPALLPDGPVSCAALSLPRSRAAEVLTRSGNAACLVSAKDPSTGGGATQYYVRAGSAVVYILAMATESRVAERLGQSVADSVRLEGRVSGLARFAIPRLDPRMFGCFTEEHTYRIGAGSGGVDVTRCLEPDGTFGEGSRGWLAAMQDRGFGPESIGNVIAEQGGRRGVWSLTGERLSLRYEDGSQAEWNIYVGEEDVLANNRLWVRE
jgi:hypothetical protein